MHDHHFTGILDRQQEGFHYHHVMLPQPVTEAFKTAGVKRVVGTANGARFRRALISDGQGGCYLIFGQDLVKAAKARLGQPVEIRIGADPNPDEIDIPEEFAELMRQDEQVAEKFHAMTPGRQRSLMIYLTQAKTSETRLKRALELGRKMVTNNLYDDRKERGEL